MGRRWTSLPTITGFLALVAGVLVIAIPNWARAQVEFQRAMELYVWSTRSDAGAVEAGIWTIMAVGRTIVFTLAAGVVEHPILTILFGFGLLLAGIWLIVEYGLLASDAEPWRDEFEM